MLANDAQLVLYNKAMLTNESMIPGWPLNSFTFTCSGARCQYNFSGYTLQMLD